MIKNKSLIKKMMLNYGFTFMVINLADSASMVIDGLITSRNLGSTLLAATGLGGTSYQIVMLCCGIFAIGLQTTCSAAMGTGDSKKTSKYFTCGVIAVTAIAAVLTLVGFLCLDPLCILFGADPSDPLLYNGLHEYMRGWFIGIPGLIAFLVLCPLVTLDGNKRLVTAVTVLQSVLNICGDYYSVVHWRGEGLRAIYGVGFSSGIAFDIAAVVLLSDFFRKRTAFKLDIRQFQLKSIKEMTRIGMPRLTKYACKMISPLVINRTVLAVGGSCAMAAMSVKSSITGFCLVAGNGIAESVCLLSQVFYSEKDKRALQEIASESVKAVAAICSVLSLLLLALTPQLTALFLAEDTEEYRLAVIMLRCFALSLALNGLNACILSYLQGTQKILPAHLQTASHRLIFLAACTIVLGNLFGTVGIFIAIPLSEILVLLTYVVISLILNRSQDRKDALLLLPEDFGYAEGESLAFSVTTMEEVIGISAKVEEFCLSHGIDKRRAFYSALCIEETAGNVVEHGFTRDNSPHSCDIRIMIEDGTVVMRIRDDCSYFNMKERYEVLKGTDVFSNIGIKLVYGIAKEVNYVNLLNTNTLILKV